MSFRSKPNFFAQAATDGSFQSFAQQGHKKSQLNELAFVVLIGRKGLFAFCFFDQALQARFLAACSILVNDVLGASLVQLLGRDFEFCLGSLNVTTFSRSDNFLDLRFHGRLGGLVAGLANFVLAKSFFRA